MSGESPTPLEASGLTRDDGGSLRVQAELGRYSRLSGAIDSGSAFDRRTETERDRGRVGYSSYLRRLSGVTQVVTPSLDAPRLHTRESHSHKVALVAREVAEHFVRIAESDMNGTAARVIAHYGGLDVAATETAGLAHDLGHPPFGHGGEVALNALLRRNNVPDGFEGNAQTFRIVSRLDRLKTDSRHGLDLNRVTLAAILKYPWLCAEDDRIDGANADSRLKAPPKFGAYEDDRAAFEAVSSLIPRGGVGGSDARQTLEAAIMDLADDVSYATHDLEDFYKERLIDFAAVKRDLEDATRQAQRGKSVEDLTHEDPNAFLGIGAKLSRSYPGYFDFRGYLDSIVSVQSLIFQRYPLDVEFDGSTATVSMVNELMGDVMKTVFHGLELTVDARWPGGPGVVLDATAWHLVQVLKTITRRYVVGTSRMGIVDRTQSVIVESLFNNVAGWLSSRPDHAQLPQPLASYLGETEPLGPELEPAHYRAIADYLCSLSDSECLARARWLSGHEVPALISAR